MSDYIPPPTLEELLKELKDLDADWVVFGVLLGVPYSQLKVIESTNKNVERCKLETLQYWLNNKIDASWKKIVQALELINQYVLASEVKKKYLWSSIGTTEPAEQAPVDINLSTKPSTSPPFHPPPPLPFQPPPPPSPPSPPPPPPPTSDMADEFQADIEADVNVVKDLQKLQTLFYGMIVQVKYCLEELECDLSVAQLFLHGVTGTDDFNSCGNFCELMELLQQHYIDIFNTFILQRLIECFKKDSLTKFVQAYENEKDNFLKQTNVLSFQRAVVSRVTPVIPKIRAVVTIKIADETVCNRTLKDIEELARKGFDDDFHKFFVRLHAEATSINISRIFPETLSSELEQKNADIFVEAGVEEVKVGGRREYPVTQQEDLLTPSQGITLEEKSAVKQVYAEFYHQLVDAVSDPLTCQSLTAQLHSTTLISQEKIAQLSHGGVTGSDLLKVLCVEEEPHLLTVLMEKMAGVKQLQKLAELMSARLNEVKQVDEADELMTVSDKQTSGQLTTVDVIHAYEVSLRASKEKEQQLQSQLATVEQESQDKGQKLSKLEDENFDLHKETGVLKYANELQQEELKRLHQKVGGDAIRLTASKEEQQQLLQQYQRMGRARDVQISQLQNENELVQDKYDTLKASYLQLKAASNEKQSVDTVDTGVQADYLAVAPGFLRGVEVYGETVLEVVGDKPQKLEWPGYGFYMEVPEGALARGVTASVGVKVILSGQFKLPDNRQLISAIYWISSSEIFLKEVAVNIQHFAVITSEEQCSKFNFIIARCSQEPPYTFRERKGSFNPHTQYGTIKLKHFSLLGEISPEGTELSFTSLKYYKPRSSSLTIVDYIFVMVYNHELFLEYIRKEYHGYSEDKQNQLHVFEDNVMVLDLPADDSPPKVVDGWRIVPQIYPKIAKVDIQGFKRGGTFPACTIELVWIGSGEPKRLSHKVSIIGAQKPDNYFYMRYSPEEYKYIVEFSSKEAASHEEIATGGQIRGVGESDQQTLKIEHLVDVLEQLSDLTVTKYKNLGLKLGLLAPTLNNLMGSENFGWDVMEAWLNQEDNVENPTWKSLIDALQSPIVGQKVTAQRVRQWLTSR